MNCTGDPSLDTDSGFRSPFAFWTLGVASIILSFFANAGNLINLFVLTRRHMRSTMTTLLVYLAWADLVPPTVVSLNNILFYHLLPHFNTSSTFLTTHLITRDFFNGFANICTTFSNWLIVIITTFRLIVVQQPLLAKNYCNRRTARSGIIMIFVLSIFLNLPLFLYSGIHVFCTDQGRIKYYGLELSSFLETKFFSRLFYPTMVIMSLLFPWLLCFFIWLFLIRALYSSQTHITTKTTTSTNNRKQDTYFRITLMIVCVLSVYMVCRSVHLFEVVQIFITSLSTLEQQIRFAQMRIKLICISNIMLTINHGANFYIYSINPKFRLTLKIYLTYYFRRCRMKRRRAFTLFHLRRQGTNDSLDGVSMPNDLHRSLMLSSLKNYSSNQRCSTKVESSLRRPQKYINQFVEPNSNNDNSEKSYAWEEIEQKMKKPRRFRRYR